MNINIDLSKLNPSKELKTIYELIKNNSYKFNDIQEKIVDILCRRTQNSDRKFYRISTALYLTEMASNMRAYLVTKDRGSVIINQYAINLAESGNGKGYSTNILENEIFSGFKEEFLNSTVEAVSTINMELKANELADTKGTSPEEELDKLLKAYNKAGTLLYTFDSGTKEGVKQYRTKLCLGKIGALNYHVDEFGSNLDNSNDLLNVGLELYDAGIIKPKLIKNTSDNIRDEDYGGITPTNMHLYGTPTKLLDGGNTQNKFLTFLETGYARRCIFGYGERDISAYKTLTPEEIFMDITSNHISESISELNDKFRKLAKVANKAIIVPDEVSIHLIAYKQLCECIADELPEHESIRKSEIAHRYFKTLKLAGAYAFVDGVDEVTIDHLFQAIMLVEESGSTFYKILNTKANYIRLAEYLASIKRPATLADLTNQLPYYKGSAAEKAEMLTLARAYGYTNGIVIKVSYVDGIAQYIGESLKKTDLNKLKVSISTDVAYNYSPVEKSLNDLCKLGSGKVNNLPIHWCNHYFNKKHRCEDETIPGFNLIVLDIDGGVTLKEVKAVLENYVYLLYTTKSYKPDSGELRARVIIPISHELKLDKDDYKNFMNSIRDWIPIPTSSLDASMNQRSKKWESNPRDNLIIECNAEGELFNELPFIPRTSENDKLKEKYSKIEHLDKLTRWLLNRAVEGDRNNTIYKYGAILKERGMDSNSIKEKIKEFNSKLESPISEEELKSTIFVSLERK